MLIAYFGHDIHDAAIRKRTRSLQRAGHEVKGLMMRRGELENMFWDNIDLGRTYDAKYRQRLVSLWRGTRVAVQHRDILKKADIILARNFDMLFCAVVACRLAKVDTPIVYECLDVHHFLTRQDIIGKAMRRIEQSLLKRTSLLVTSSPAFEQGYFRRYHEGRYKHYLLENRLDVRTLPDRPAERPAPFEGHRQALRVGWYGVLRCRRSLHLLADLANRFEGRVQVVTAGKTVLEDFDSVIENTPAMSYSGPYQAPDDLAGLYGDVDVVWAGDFYQADFNSLALLPNRIYEGGYFAVPAIAPADSATGRWVEHRGTGFTVEEPLDEKLPALVAELLESPEQIAQTSRAMMAMPSSVFSEAPEAMDSMLEAAIEAHREERAA